MLPDPYRPAPAGVSPSRPLLERRVPGDTDLRIFTTEVIPGGQHRVRSNRPGLRVVRDRKTGRPVLRLAALVLVGSLALGACGTGGPVEGGSAVPPAGTGDPLALAGVFPSTVVFQSDWYPEMEYAAYYSLLGGRYRVNASAKRVTGDLVASGKDTGVDLEIRVGGPAIGFQAVSSYLYQDRSITLGQAALDESVQNSADKPTLQVLAPMEYVPLAIGWDRARHPDWTSIADIGQTPETVLYFKTDAYMQYLLGAGLLRPSQVDGSFDGSPARFVASRGGIAQQIFATQQPYVYRHELLAGKSFDLGYQLVADIGYPLYGQGVVIRVADKDRLAPCLRKLVPIIQRSQVDVMTNPARVSALIVDVVRKYRDAWTYSPGLAAFTVKQMADLGLVANGKDHTLGNFDEERVRKLIDILAPIYAAQHKAIRPGLKPADLVTNEFVDAGIGLPPGR